MKLNKLSFLAGAVALTLTAIPFVAQANRANANINSSSPTIVARGRKQGMRMLKRLNLTDDQKAQIQEIKKSARDEMKKILTPEQLEKLEEGKANGMRKRELWGSLGITDAQKAEIKKLRESKKSQIKAILTEDQKQQLEQMRQNRSSRRQQRGN